MVNGELLIDKNGQYPRRDGFIASPYRTNPNQPKMRN